MALCSTPLQAADLAPANSTLYYRGGSGYLWFTRVVHYWRVPVVHPAARVDPRIDPRLMRAAAIAQQHATARSQARCWHYVKDALVAAGAISSYPKTAYAAEAGDELVHTYGFKRLPIRDPYAAPVGAVIVYGNRSRGHVELRTRDGFVSDYHSKNACFYPLIAVYGKFSS